MNEVIFPYQLMARTRINQNSSRSFFFLICHCVHCHLANMTQMEAKSTYPYKYHSFISLLITERRRNKKKLSGREQFLSCCSFPHTHITTSKRGSLFSFVFLILKTALGGSKFIWFLIINFYLEGYFFVFFIRQNLMKKDKLSEY